MEKVSPRYVENCRIILSAHLENGLTNLGDLWNCRSSQAVGHNLFKVNSIPTEHLRATPIRKCECEFTHVKNDLETAKSLKIDGLLSLDFLANIVKLDGNLKVEDDTNNESHKEVVSCRYLNRNYQIDVIPPIDSLINEHVLQLISSGQAEATHVVGGIIIGSSITALIDISQNESKNDREASGGGRIGAEASGKEKDNKEKTKETKKIADDTNGNDESESQSGTNKKICNQETGYKGALQKNGESIWKGGWLKSLTGSYSAEVKAEWSEKDKSGNYAIKVSCDAQPMPSDLPLTRTVTQLFELIENMPSAMSKELHFYINNRGISGVPIQFVLYPIAHFARLETIKLYKSLENDLMDKFQVMLSKAIEIQEIHYVKKLILMRDKELAFLLNKKSVLSDNVGKFEDSLKQIGAEFVNRSRKQLGEYKYGKCGPEELSTIIQDFYASDAGLIEKTIQELVEEGASEVSVVKGSDESHVKKFTNDQDKQMWKEVESNPKIILEIGPKCSETTTNGYYQLIAPLGEIGVKMALVMPSIAKELKLSLIIDKHEEIFKDYEVKEAIDILCANFRIGNQARAEFFAVAAAIDGTEFPMRKTFSQFSITLKIMLSLTEACKDFKFTDSVNELKYLIRKLPADHVAFCVPIDAPETALDLLQTWKDYKINDVVWIVHSLECNGEQEAPLLFVMSNSKVIAICLDRLDLLILEERIKEAEKICDVNFDLLAADQLSKSFYEQRASCAFRFLSRVFPISIGTANQTLIKTETRSEVTEFLSFIRKCLSSNEMVILSSVAQMVVYDFPNLISTLTKYGWNDSYKMFYGSISNNDSGREMVSEIEKWLEDDSLIREIDQAVCYDIANHSHCPIGFKLQLEDYKSMGYSDSHKRVLDILKELRICGTSTKSHFSFVHVRIFLKALRRVISENQSVDALIKLLIKEYHNNFKSYFSDKLIENYVRNNQIYLLLQEVSPNKYEEKWMCAFLKGIRTLRRLDDIDTLTRVIENLSVLCTDIDFTKQLWTNEKWLLVIRRCINVKHDNNIPLLRSVLRWVKKMGIECIMPNDIQQKLKSTEIAELGKLSSVEDVERFLERELYERLKIPWYSTNQLKNAFQENPSLESELIKVGTAIHWDPDNKRFIAEWSNRDMRQALGEIKWSRISSRVETFTTAMFEKKQRLSSLNLVAYILSTVDRTCAEEVLQAVSKLPYALPLIIPDILDENKFIVTLPLLKDLVTRLEMIGKAVDSHLFSSPFRLIVAVRDGAQRMGIGKSRLLNEFMSHPCYFSSGVLPGTVEFACNFRAFDELSLRSLSLKNGNEILLLANLHGNAVNFPDIVKYLKRIASCFVVFQSSDRQLLSSENNRDKLKSWFSGCPVVPVTMCSDRNRTRDEVRRCIKEAVGFEPNWKALGKSNLEELLNIENIYSTATGSR